MRLKIRLLEKELEKVQLGGGKKRIDKIHSAGKLTARERIKLLLDKGSEMLEIAAFAGHGMYADYGGCPSGGVVVVIGVVSGRRCVVVANDATVKAGAWFPITGKKNLRAQEIAMENHLPIIYLVDSAGVFLPMQEEIFADKEHFGRIFRNNAKMSAQGIVQIAAVMGSCVAGGAYLPIMSDESLIVNKTGTIFLAGSYLVKAAIGENIDNETLGEQRHTPKFLVYVTIKLKTIMNASKPLEPSWIKSELQKTLDLIELNPWNLKVQLKKYMVFYRQNAQNRIKAERY